MTDTLRRFVFEHAPVRGLIVQLGAAWRAVLERHEYPPVLQRLLGETMAAAALLAATLKFEGSMIMQMHGSGPVKLLVVECTSDLHLRATAKWDGDPVGASIGELLGQGRFVITLAAKDGTHNYQAAVALEGADIAQVLRHYMLNSEQLDTRLWLATDAMRACGMLLQKLPGEAVADADAWQRATVLAATVTSRELLELPARRLIRRLFHQEDVRLFEPAPLAFRCSCSRARVGEMLRMLGKAEAEGMLDERGSIEVTCEFCRRRFVFDRVDSEQVFLQTPGTQSTGTHH
jgi:molecular chaperone Hsp33